MEICISNLNKKITWNISWNIPAWEHEMDIPTLLTVQNNFIRNLFLFYFQPCIENNYTKHCIEQHTNSCLFAEIPQSWDCAWLKWEVHSHIPFLHQTHSLIPTCWKPNQSSQLTTQGKLDFFPRKVAFKWEWEEEEEEEGERKRLKNEERKKVDEKGGGTHMGCLDLSQTCRFLLQRTCQANLTACAVMGTLRSVVVNHHHHSSSGFLFLCLFHSYIWINKRDW